MSKTTFANNSAYFSGNGMLEINYSIAECRACGNTLGVYSFDNSAMEYEALTLCRTCLTLIMDKLSATFEP